MLVVGALLLIVGALLVLVEAHVPTGGVIGGGAVIALVVGAAMMLSAAGAPGLLVLVLALFALGAGAYAILVLGRSLIRYRRLRPRTGAEALVGTSVSCAVRPTPTAAYSSTGRCGEPRRTGSGTSCPPWSCTRATASSSSASTA